MNSSLTKRVCAVRLHAALRLIVAWAFFSVSSLAWSGPADLFIPLPKGASADAAVTDHTLLKQLQSSPTTASLRLVTVDMAALSNNTPRLALGDAAPVTAVGKKYDVKDDKNFVWEGSLRSTPGNATFVIRNGKITGTIRNGADLYRVQSVGNNVHAIIKVDQSKFPKEDPPRPADQQSITPASTHPTSSTAPVNPPVVTIRVLVAYTPAAAKMVANMDALIQLAMRESNAAYKNSDIPIQLVLAGTLALNYKEADQFDQVLSDFVANAAVKARRMRTNADLSALIIDKDDYCGLADAIGATADTAYAIVHYNCIPGYYSFAHELGHLMGARHDPANDSTMTPIPYAHGFQHTAPESWRTIMAYDCSPSCPRLQFFSNPRKSYSGSPTGTADVSDVARVLTNSAPMVASFHQNSASTVAKVADPAKSHKADERPSPPTSK